MCVCITGMGGQRPLAQAHITTGSPQGQVGEISHWKMSNEIGFNPCTGFKHWPEGAAASDCCNHLPRHARLLWKLMNEQWALINFQQSDLFLGTPFRCEGTQGSPHVRESVHKHPHWVFPEDGMGLTIGTGVATAQKFAERPTAFLPRPSANLVSRVIPKSKLPHSHVCTDEFTQTGATYYITKSFCLTFPGNPFQVRGHTR